MSLKGLFAFFPILIFNAHASPVDNFTIEVMPVPYTAYSNATLVDMDGDGFLDVLLNYQDSLDQYLLGAYHNEKGKGWAHSVSNRLNKGSYSVFGQPCIGDMDGDGRLDLMLNRPLATANKAWFLKGLPRTGVAGLDTGNFFPYAKLTEADLPSGAAIFHSPWNRNTVAWFKNPGDSIVRFSDAQYFSSAVGYELAEKIGRTANIGVGDFNSDGIEDAVGFPSYDYKFDSAVYRMSGPGGYTDQVFSRLHFWNGSLVAGDYDNDGDLDLVASGMSQAFFGNSNLWAFYENKDGTFVETLLDDDYGPGYGAALLGDMDNDGDLDIVCTGRYVNNTLFRNKSAVKNEPPSTPASAQMRLEGNSLVFSWNRSSDDLTPSLGLTYNVSLRSKRHSGPGSYFTGADSATGKLLFPHFGNFGGITVDTIPLAALAPDRYSWGVQAIDNGYAASKFAWIAFEVRPDGTVALNPRPSKTTAAEKIRKRMAMGRKKGFLAADGRRF